jgi:hypothetical protein
MALKIELNAALISGEVLSGAAVTVFAPDAGSTPWTTAETDKSGHVTLMPDVQQAGVWIVQIASDKKTALLRFPIQAGDIDLAKGIDIETDGLTVTYHLTRIPAALVTLTAKFEGGEVMSEGQVTIYTPDNAKTPWLTGVCDAEGRYSFIADTTNLGTWEIQVRQAGHDEWVRIPVEENMVQIAPVSIEKTPELTPNVHGTSGAPVVQSQPIGMAMSIVWV